MQHFLRLASSPSRRSRRSADATGATAPAAPRMESLENRRLLSAGALDTTFGTGGRMIDNSLPAPKNLKVAANGQITVAGTLNGDFYVARYNADGTRDATFGSGGLATADFSGNDVCNDLTVQQDGKIVLVGTSGGDFIAARFNADGTLDAGFGPNGNGLLATNLGGDDQANVVTQQPDGKIVAGGISDQGAFQQAALVRYNADGSPDTSFGANGVLLTGSTGDSLIVFSVLVQPDGKIIQAGTRGGNDTPSFMIERFNSDGTPDGSAFPAADLFPGGQNGFRALALTKSGKIVAVGSASNAPASAGGSGGGTIFRFNPDGTADTAFGSTGHILSTPAANRKGAAFSQVYVRADNHVVVGEQDLARYRANGALDTAFGGSGEASTDFTGANPLAGLARGPGGTAVTAGASSTGTLEIERFLDETPPAVDTAAPGATLSARRQLRQSGSNVLQFVVTYTDDVAVRASSIDNNDVRVFGPGGFVQSATLVSRTASTSPGVRRGVYQVTAPAGGFADGIYNVNLRAGQVFDTAGNSALGARLGVINLNGQTLGPSAVPSPVTPLTAQRKAGPGDLFA